MTDRSARGEQAFERAVRRERDAITLHERAAALHDATADRLDEESLAAIDATDAEGLRERAAAERHLAGLARARAAGVRARLTAEGVDDVG
ncbi:hypothetical protein DQ237_11850 [Blastococcus sp. TF02-8]|uniref:hypothetical protein n=1 Tax=Blastococcus sp. TF02-8 TaxID=2250574 RepID=UPI000DEAC513|nr:hypothetical protein [Blastococcus sp. TF02-8]RBY95835.1 hypothetical protein DQ237_11850 [Blastococcus sp. TF02-8]